LDLPEHATSSLTTPLSSNQFSAAILAKTEISTLPTSAERFTLSSRGDKLSDLRKMFLVPKKHPNETFERAGVLSKKRSSPPDTPVRLLLMFLRRELAVFNREGEIDND